MEVPSHHLKQDICATRAPYREGRHPKAVKVYTVNNESIYLIIQGVPSVGATEELKKLCSSFGPVEDLRPLDEYPCEDKYTEVYLVKYKKIQSARFAKRKLDEHSFFGGNLHVFYTPEYESLQETRDKLRDRRQVVAKKIRQHATQSIQNQQQTGPDASYPQSNVASLDSRVQPLHVENRLSPQHADLQAPSLNQAYFPLLSSSSTTKPTSEPSVSQFHESEESNASPLQATSQEVSESQLDDDVGPNVFELPLPPKPSMNSQQKRYTNWRHYEYSMVPTAHANLPSGYDGRLSIPKSSPVSKGSGESQNETITGQDITPFSQPPQIVIKDYTPQKSTPRFVPRQAVKTAPPEQKPADGARASPGVGSEDDNLRQNAFRLGSVQGPEEMPGRKRALPTAAQQSVNNTILSIRSKISKVIGEKVRKKP